MVQPTKFYFNTQTSGDNVFMTNSEESVDSTSDKAINEFIKFRKSLQELGVEIVTYEQQADDLPDSCFPNNWVSTHPDKFVTYQMMSENRNKEYNPKVVEFLSKSK